MRDLRKLFIIAVLLAMIFTFDEPGWAFTAGPDDIFIGTDAGYPSPNKALVVGPPAGNIYPGTTEIFAYLQSISLNVGTQYAVTAWVNSELADESTPIVIRIAAAFSDFLGYVRKSETLGHGFALETFGTFIAMEPTADISVGILNDEVSDPPAQVVGRWTIDDIKIAPATEGEMARMLAAFGVRSVMSRALSALNIEIGYVKLEANLGIDLPPFTAWRSYDAGLATPDVVEFEAFEIGPVTFPSESYDRSTFNVGQRTRSLSSLPMRVAINHANRGNADAANATLLASQMAERSRFYAAAIFRCFENDPTCGQGSALTVVPGQVRTSVRDLSRISGDIRQAGRVEYDFTLRLQETSAGETTSGGASLPSVNMETP